MHAQEIHECVKAQPFQPLRIFVSDGSHYDVFHPDLVIASNWKIVVGIASPTQARPEKVALIDPLHVTRIEPVPTPNGQKKKRPRGKR